MAKLGRLNGDVSDLVLLKLPTRDLLQMKCVSKGWRETISGRSFARDHSLRSHPLPLSGFLFQQRSCSEPPDFSVVSYISTEMEEPPRLLKTPVDSIPENFAIASSCNGLICCMSFSSDLGTLAIQVGIPVTREWVRVDWNGSRGNAIAIGLSFDPCSDLNDSSTNFKLGMVWGMEEDDSSNRLSFHVYSSETKSWRLSEQIRGQEWDLPPSDNECVSVKGVMYWRSNTDEILVFDVEKEMSYELPVPWLNSEIEVEMMVDCVGESDGKLQYVILSKAGLMIWVLEDLHKEKWSLQYTMPLADIENGDAGLSFKKVAEEQLLLHFMVFRDGVLILRVSNMVFSFDTRMNRVGQHIVLEFGTEGMFDSLVVPYSMSLVPLNQP